MCNLSKDEMSQRIVKNVAALVDELASEKTFILNLGVGIPTLVADHVTCDNVFIQAENGMLGVGPIASGDDVHPQLINAGRQPVTQTDGCSFFDSCASFGMIRGGHVDATVLGAFEVDKEANVSNWIIPGGKQLGVGGAMDLVTGAKIVIIAMTHTTKGKPKLVETCALPITGFNVVDYVVTELGVFTHSNGYWELIKIAPEITIETLRSLTGFFFDVADNISEMLS